MKKTVMLLLPLMLAAGAWGAAAAPHKYDVKSGIVTLDSLTKLGQLELKMQVVVSFDDYGVKECKETYMNGKLEKVYFSDGKNLYTLQLKKKLAVNKGKAYQRGTELRVEFSEMGTQTDRASGKVRQVAPVQIAGKTCDLIEVKSGNEVSQYGGWKKVMVYLKTDPTVIKATKIEENAAVPVSKFQVPAGFTIQ